METEDQEPLAGGGDLNSKYFHAMASARKRHNSIAKIRDRYGAWVVARLRFALLLVIILLIFFWPHNAHLILGHWPLVEQCPRKIKCCQPLRSRLMNSKMHYSRCTLTNPLGRMDLTRLSSNAFGVLWEHTWLTTMSLGH